MASFFYRALYTNIWSMFVGVSNWSNLSNIALIDGAVIQLLYFMCVSINSLDVLQLQCFFPHTYTKISSQASQGSWAHIYTRSSSFFGRKIFLFNAAVQFFFFAVCLWIRVRQRVMWSWQQRRLLLRDSHFSFSPAVFFPVYCQCYWPLVGIWIFKRHFISLSCSYSQGKGGKSCTVFLFYPPWVWTCRWTRVKLLYFPLMPPSLVSCTSFALRLKLLRQTWKAESSTENLFKEVFSGV